MGLFKTKALASREIKEFDEKIKAIYDNGIPDLAQNTNCEIVIKGDQILINPLSGPERKIILNVSQISSVSVLPWGEFALKFLHTNISIPKNSPGREYLVIIYAASDGTQKIISFWGSTLLLKMQQFSKKIDARIAPKEVHL